MSVATLIVDLAMLYVLPHRKFYNKYKYEETVDFSDVRDAEALHVDDETFAAQMHNDLSHMRAQPLLLSEDEKMASRA